MMLIKKVSTFESRCFYKNKEISYDNVWYIESFCMSIRNTNILTNELRYTDGIVLHDFISFDRGEHTLTIEVCIPKELIQFTKCYYFCPKVEVGVLKGDRYDITYVGLLKFVYIGPKELELIWRLSL